jgi:hypothetical protein
MQTHFDAWKKAGMSLGSMDYQVLCTEGHNNAAGSTTRSSELVVQGEHMDVAGLFLNFT